MNEKHGKKEWEMKKSNEQDNACEVKVKIKLLPTTRVYVLSGASHLGKSTTLNKLADELNKASGWKLTKGYNPPFKGRKDTKYIFENTSRGIIVGISTAGDDEDQISKGFNFFRTNKCDVCFIASKTSGVSIISIETECNKDGIIPQYHFLIGETSGSVGISGLRTQNKVQSDVVTQLINLI